MEDLELAGETHTLTEVTQWGRPDADIPRVVPTVEAGQRLTSLVISEAPPYLIGRGDYRLEADGSLTPTREQPDLVDWAAIPLPASDLVDLSIWVENESESPLPFLRLADEHTPRLLYERNSTREP